MTRGGPNDGLRLSSCLSILSSLICSLSGLVSTSSITVSRAVRPRRDNGGHRDCSCLATEMERPAANGAPECGNRGCCQVRSTECRSPRDQKQLAADLSHSSASAKERTRSSRDGAFAAAARQAVLNYARVPVDVQRLEASGEADLRLAGGACVPHPADLAVGGRRASARRLRSACPGLGRAGWSCGRGRIPGSACQPEGGERLVTAFASQRDAPRREARRWSSSCVREPLGRSVR